jgi:glycosyltransferase involved in cell wall biosynthesis
MKVILILNHSDSVFYQHWNFNLYKNEDWHVQIANQINRRTSKYKLEVWRPERLLKNPVYGYKNNILYRAFPSVRFNWKKEYSISLIREVQREFKTGPILLNLLGFNQDINYLIILLSKKVPIVASHLGGNHYGYDFIYNLPLSIIERPIVKKIDKILVNSPIISKYLSHMNRNIVICPPVGVDFDEFKITDKKEAKKMLEFSENEKIMLHVGRFYKEKGLDLVLKAYQTLKKKMDVNLIVIGGQKKEPLYNTLKNAGVIVKERGPKKDLLTYYNAADVYLFPAFPPMLFGGIGTAPLESLACGTPVVGTNLIHFLGTEEELNQIGHIPRSFEEVLEYTQFVLDNPENYKNCRDVTKKYFDWDNIINRLLPIYDGLFEKYYKIKV